MLEDFIVAHRDEIIRRCRGKVARRSAPPPTEAEIDHGVPIFLDELLDELRFGLSANPEIANTAAKHGRDLLRRGFTPSQVVHDYGDVCQAITEMAIESHAPVSSGDFRILNRCLDDAIAAAITEYERERDDSTRGNAAHDDSRIRFLGEALSASVLTARGAFEAIQSGNVGISGSTGAVLARSLRWTEDLNERLQVEIRDFAQKR